MITILITSVVSGEPEIVGTLDIRLQDFVCSKYYGNRMIQSIVNQLQLDSQMIETSDPHKGHSPLVEDWDVSE